MVDNNLSTANVEIPEFITVEKLALVMGIAKSTAYELTRKKGFPCVRCGNTIRIPLDLLNKWIFDQAGCK